MKAALRLISEDNNGGILSLDSYVLSDNSETVRESLLKKHPPSSPHVLSDIINGNVNSVV